MAVGHRQSLHSYNRESTRTSEDECASGRCYDKPTQLEQGSDANCDFICEDCDFGDADVFYYNAEGEDGDLSDGNDYAEVNYAEDNSVGDYSD